MAFNKNMLKVELSQLSKAELTEIVLKLAAKRYNYEYLLVNFLDPSGGEQSLFQEALDDIELLFEKSYNGRTVQHQRVKLLKACIKRIDEFKVETKSRKLEADLLLHVLHHEFDAASSLFGAKFSGFDYKIALLLKRLISIVTLKIHPDYIADYANEINSMLQQLHSSSDRMNTVKQLPRGIDY